MQLESLVSLYYTFIHIAPFDGLIFYAFRRYLRLGAARTALGYLALLAVEGAVQVQLSGVYDQRVSLWFQLTYLVYDLWAIRAYGGKVLAVGLLTAPLSLLSFSAAAVAEQQWPLSVPEATGGVVIALLTRLVSILGRSLRIIPPAWRAFGGKNPESTQAPSRWTLKMRGPKPRQSRARWVLRLGCSR